MISTVVVVITIMVFCTVTASSFIQTRIHCMKLHSITLYNTSSQSHDKRNCSNNTKGGKILTQISKRKDKNSVSLAKTKRASNGPTARSVAISALANAGRPRDFITTDELATTEDLVNESNEGQYLSTLPSHFTYSTRELEHSKHYQLLDARDRAFARLLVATVERRQGQIDKVIQSCVTKPIRGKYAKILQATLRVGVAQLIFLYTPPFAAIKETVEVLRMIAHPTNIPESLIKFTNGVLRNLSRPSNSAYQENGTDEEMHAVKLLKERTSPEDNISPWLLRQWKRDWGEKKSELICQELMPNEDVTASSMHRIDLTTLYSIHAAMDMRDESIIKLQSLLSSFGDDSILLPQFSIRVGSSQKGDVKSWPGYEDGTWWVQDASATLPALVLTKALLDSNYAQSQLSGINIVDMCSAPGGKTLQLLSVGFGRVTAVEANPRRSQRLVENLTRLNMFDRCQVIVDEGQNWIPSSDMQPVHGLLLDVPCSATGTGRKRPDILRKNEDSLIGLIETQEKLANHCVDNILKVGGIMVYATCSILKIESEGQVQKLIDQGKVETLPILPHEVPGFEDAIDDNGWLRILPGVLRGQLQSTDGFFVARLVRK